MMPESMCATSPSTTIRRRLAELLVGLLCFFALAAAPASAEVVDRIVLRVNDEIVTLHQYRQQLSERLEAIRDADVPEEARQRLKEEAGRAVLRDLFDEMLLLSRADQLGIRATPEQVEMAVTDARQRSGLTTEEEFKAALERSGMTYDGLRKRMERNIVLQMVMGREVQSRIQPNEEEGLRFYRKHQGDFQVPEKVHLREVVILESGGPAGADRDFARSLRDEIGEGKDLEAVVEPYQLAGRTTGVIDLGWVSLGDLDEALSDAVSGLGAGAISEPTEARGGLHVLELLEREPAHVQPYNEVQDEVMRRLREESFASTLDEYMAEIEEAAYIRADPPPEAEGFRVARSERLSLEDFLGGLQPVTDEEEPPAASSPDPD